MVARFRGLLSSHSRAASANRHTAEGGITPLTTPELDLNLSEACSGIGFADFVAGGIEQGLCSLATRRMSMGERLAFFRLPPTDDDEQASKALDHVDRAEYMRAELAEAVASLFAGSGTFRPPFSVGNTTGVSTASS